MTAETDKLRELFLAALKVPAGERDAYLRQACTGADELRERVKLLIQAHEELGSIAPSAEAEVGPTIDQPMTETAGTIIGPYKLLELIGEGGMGTVWMAEQTEPIQRRVALKVIKEGMDSRQVLARFEAERQALALMEHPNIAKILDAGKTPSGRPYFVMELVKGVPITKYCDEKRLAVRERLELFGDVCRAVQHAHQKGIIHRDLKPSNVLVAQYDGKPVPKVIDFGVAKAAGQQLTDKTLVTGFGAIVGTLEYMSPEQAEINQLDIDTRSDIYSLGVLLYELLTGSPPFSRKELETAGMLEMLRVIREKEPSKPSTKLSSSDALPTLAANRGTEPAKLTKLVKGELDWIVMKALEKDRNRRYETANGFAMDVQRYLHDEPVLACPPSAGYRLRKFARRNKRPLATIGLIALALIVGTTVSIRQAIRATDAESLAEQRLDAVTKEHAEAMGNLQKAREAGDEFFTRVSESRLLDQPGLQTLREELLEASVRYYEGLATGAGDDPNSQMDLAVASLRLAQIYYQTGFCDRHVSTLNTALGLVEKLVHDYPDSPELHLRLAGFWHGGRVLAVHWQPVGDKRSALDVYQRAIRVWERLSERYPTAAGFQDDLSKFYHLQSDVQRELGQQEQYLRSLQKVIEIREQVVRTNPGVYEHVCELAHAYTFLAPVLEVRDPQAADELYRKAIALQKDVPDVACYQETLAGHHWLFANFLKRQKRAAEAAEHLQQAIGIYEELATKFPYMSGYGGTAAAWRNELNGLRGDDNRLDQIAKVKEKQPPRPAPVSLNTLKIEDAPAALHAVARLYRQAGDASVAGKGRTMLATDLLIRWAGPQATKKAEEAYRTAILLLEKLPTEEMTAIDQGKELAHCYDRLGCLLRYTDPPQAEKLLRQALPIRQKLAAGSPGQQEAECALALTCHGLACVLRDRGKLTEARDLLKQAIAHQPFRGDLEWHYFVLGWTLVRLAEHAGAANAAADLLRIAPDDALWHLHAARLLAACVSLAENDARLSETDRNTRAHTYGEKAKEYAQRAVELLKVGEWTPNSAQAHNDLAWFLATYPDPKFRDPAKAVQLAKKAVDMAPKEGYIWNTLGVAHYRAEEWKAAIEALTKSKELLGDKELSFNAFFLGMAHWQLGAPEEARRWYGQAVAWMEKNKPDDQELCRFRAEAEELLKIKKDTKPK